MNKTEKKFFGQLVDVLKKAIVIEDCGCYGPEYYWDRFDLWRSIIKKYPEHEDEKLLVEIYRESIHQGKLKYHRTKKFKEMLDRDAGYEGTLADVLQKKKERTKDQEEVDRQKLKAEQQTRKTEEEYKEIIRKKYGKIRDIKALAMSAQTYRSKCPDAVVPLSKKAYIFGHLESKRVLIDGTIPEGRVIEIPDEYLNTCISYYDLGDEK